jgi:hypothetical protein
VLKGLRRLITFLAALAMYLSVRRSEPIPESRIKCKVARRSKGNETTDFT